jgi:predicted ArsR family transcriptional regulator
MRAIVRAGRGGATQREVADRLAVTKVEARRLLRAAVAERLVDETVVESPAAPGRRMFSVTAAGIAELNRAEGSCSG